MNLRHFITMAERLFEAERVDPTDNPKFRAWFGDSKVVDASGNPLVVYHGTNQEFTSFDPKRSIGSQFWFTDSRDTIERGEVGAQSRGVILEVYLSMQNPAGWHEYENLLLGQIRSRGHDGLILPGKDDTTYVVFNPRQIKSVHNKSFNPRTSHLRR